MRNNNPKDIIDIDSDLNELNVVQESKMIIKSFENLTPSGPLNFLSDWCKDFTLKVFDCIAVNENIEENEIYKCDNGKPSFNISGDKTYSFKVFQSAEIKVARFKAQLFKEKCVSQSDRVKLTEQEINLNGEKKFNIKYEIRNFFALKTDDSTTESEMTNRDIDSGINYLKNIVKNIEMPKEKKINVVENPENEQQKTNKQLFEKNDQDKKTLESSLFNQFVQQLSKNIEKASKNLQNIHVLIKNESKLDNVINEIKNMQQLIKTMKDFYSQIPSSYYSNENHYLLNTQIDKIMTQTMVITLADCRNLHEAH